jgi:hypothetical protein
MFYKFYTGKLTVYKQITKIIFEFKTAGMTQGGELNVYSGV